jgi:hypothetical protein
MISSWGSKHVAKHLCPINESWYVSIDLFLCVDIIVVYCCVILTLLQRTRRKKCVLRPLHCYLCYYRYPTYWSEARFLQILPPPKAKMSCTVLVFKEWLTAQPLWHELINSKLHIRNRKCSPSGQEANYDPSQMVYTSLVFLPEYLVFSDSYIPLFRTSLSL